MRVARSSAESVSKTSSSSTRCRQRREALGCGLALRREHDVLGPTVGGVRSALHEPVGLRAVEQA